MEWYGGSWDVPGALAVCCWAIQLAKPDCDITVPVPDIAPCQTPHSSAQRTVNEPTL
jgi:hypothetical protein